MNQRNSEKKKLNEIYETKNEFAVELCFANLYYAL